MIDTPRDFGECTWRAKKLFRFLGIQSVEDLAKHSASSLRSLTGVGATTFWEAKNLLETHGLCFAADHQPQQVQTEKPSVPLKNGQQRLYMVQASDYSGWATGYQFPMRVATRDTLADMVERCAVDIAEFEVKERGNRGGPSSLQVRVNIMELEVAT